MYSQAQQMSSALRDPVAGVISHTASDHSPFRPNASQSGGEVLGQSGPLFHSGSRWIVRP
eukprot:14332138-Alexandrium_andersonii.AAC.1